MRFASQSRDADDRHATPRIQVGGGSQGTRSQPGVPGPSRCLDYVVSVASPGSQVWRERRLEEETMEASAAPSVIAVGMDGSEHARRALRWAIDEARFRGAALRVVTAWHVPLVVQERGSGSAPPAMVSLEDLVRDAAEGVGSSAVDEVRDAGVEALEPVIREGQAADVLVDVSTGADLLVIGSRGHGGFSGLLAGSVSMQCVQHSHCPTTVVH